MGNEEGTGVRLRLMDWSVRKSRCISFAVFLEFICNKYLN